MKLIKKIKKFKSGSIFIQFNRGIESKDDEKEFLKRLEQMISRKKGEKKHE